MINPINAVSCPGFKRQLRYGHGLRKDEAATLRWANVHLNGKPPTLTVTDTKNGYKHTIPLSSYVHEVLRARRKQPGNEFVFPGKGNVGHIVEIRKQTKKMVVELDHYFTCHDLRRTFASVAERVNLGEYTKKRLLNFVSIAHFLPPAAMVSTTADHSGLGLVSCA